MYQMDDRAALLGLMQPEVWPRGQGDLHRLPNHCAASYQPSAQTPADRPARVISQIPDLPGGLQAF